MKNVKVIILTWNCLNFTKKCIASITEIEPGIEFGTIVVDNGSTDGTLEYLKSIDVAKIISNGKNLGFSAGNNIGMKAAGRSDVVLLNNDIIVTQKNWLKKLQDMAYSSPEIGIVGCRLLDAKGSLLHAGTYIYPETFWGQQIGGLQADVNQFNQKREVEGVVFACVYIKRVVLDRVGELDEAFFSYFEDTDYCFRVKQSGFKVVCCGEVTLIHDENTSTKHNKVSFNKVFLESQTTFKAKWNEILRARYKSVLGWHSIVNFPSGYAISSKNFMLALDTMGVDIRYRYVYGEGTPFPIKESEEFKDYRLGIFRSRDFSENYPQVVYGQGDIFYKNSGHYKIGYTMLEVTGIPKLWVSNANQMNEVWVPSVFNQETFSNSGVNVPIHVMPLGVDENYFNPEIKAYKLNDRFTFLSVFEWGERKAPEKLLRAYCEEFNRSDQVLLLCKVMNNDGSVSIPSEIANLNLPKNHAPIMILCNNENSGGINGVTFIHCPAIPDHQLGTLYRSADCFVLPTRGEGWGMPFLEAMACGLPVIVTDWSAHCDFVNETNSYLLRVKSLIDAKAKCPYYAGFKWADADEDHLMFLMRHVYENREEARNKGLKASADVLTNWTWEKAAEKIVNRLGLITYKT